MKENYFKKLYGIGLSEKEKTKQNLTYIDWASVWAEMKKEYPEANYKIHRNEISRPWFDDGNTGWVTVTVTVPYEDDRAISHTVDLPIMNMKNQSIPANEITSVHANKSWQRCLVKACAMHGVGLYVYAKMEDTEENTERTKLQQECMSLMQKKAALSEETKAEIAKICIAADDIANGDPRLIEDVDTLHSLKRKLMAVRVKK